MKRVLDRRIQPVALGLTLTMLVVAQANFRGFDRGTEPPLSYFVAVAATVAALALTVGWAMQKQRLVEFGLLMVVLAYAARAAAIAMTNPWDQAILFSLATVVLAGGSYYVEVLDRHVRSLDRRGQVVREQAPGD